MGNESRWVVIVLGAGRSGTSLMMQFLSAVGMSISEKMIGPRAHNAIGPMEDIEIADYYDKFLLPTIHSTRVLPIPYSSISEELDNKLVSEFTRIIRKYANETECWGFKDPLTSQLIPYWTRAFNRAGVVPKYILCIRNPAHAATSRKLNFGQVESIGELAWLVNTIYALHDTNADCFISHYEDWFVNPRRLAEGLLIYTGLGKIFHENLDGVIANTIKSNLNHANRSDYQTTNFVVNKLYATLLDCHGVDFDRARLMAVVKECRMAMDGFKGWYQVAHQANKKLSEVQLKLEMASEAAAKVKTLETRIQSLELEMRRKDKLTAHVQKLQRQLDQLMNL